jgi:small subunit ribosomal protein S16
MLKIKLAPRGKTHQITYRIVVAEDRSKLNGPAIDDLGFYTPQTKIIELDKQKMANWLKKGAQITFGVDRLLNPSKYPKKIKPKVEKIKKETKAEETNVEEVKKEAVIEEVKTEEIVEEVKTEEAKNEEVQA